MFKNMVLSILIIFTLLLLTACGVTTGSQSKDVKDEIWDTSSTAYYAVLDSTYNKEWMSDLEYENFMKIYDKYTKGTEVLTEQEDEIINNVFDLVYLNHKIMDNYDNEGTDIGAITVDLQKFGEIEKELHKYFKERKSE